MFLLNILNEISFDFWPISWEQYDLPDIAAILNIHNLDELLKAVDQLDSRLEALLLSKIQRGTDSSFRYAL